MDTSTIDFVTPGATTTNALHPTGPDDYVWPISTVGQIYQLSASTPTVGYVNTSSDVDLYYVPDNVGALGTTGEDRWIYIAVNGSVGGGPAISSDGDLVWARDIAQSGGDDPYASYVAQYAGPYGLYSYYFQNGETTGNWLTFLLGQTGVKYAVATTPQAALAAIQSTASTTETPLLGNWNKIDGGMPTAMTAGDFNGAGSTQLAISELGGGTYIYDPANAGWTKIDGGVPTLMVALDPIRGTAIGIDQYVYDKARLAAYFPGSGIYTWQADAGWKKIDAGAATAMVADDVFGTGSYELAVSESGAGTYLYDPSNGGWTKLDSSVASLMVSGKFHFGDSGYELAAYFDGYGTYTWGKDAGWTKIDGGKPSALVAGNFLGAAEGNNNQTDLAAYFPGAGTYLWNSATHAWSKIDGGAASGMAAVDLNGDGQNELLAYFPNYGTYEWQAGVGWSRYDLTSALPISAQQALFATGNFLGGTNVVAAVGFDGASGLWLDPPAGAGGAIDNSASSLGEDGATSANLALLGHYMASSFPPSGIASGGQSLSDSGQTITPRIVPPHAVG
jgi:hypothetical protein